MAKYVVVHSPMDAKINAGDTFAKFAKECIDAFTDEVHCDTTWSWGGGTSAVCVWEAPDEQALIEFFAARRTLEVPVNGIFPVSITDWAEAAKAMA
jgi:hypothetical protein